MASRTGFRAEVRDPVATVEVPEFVRHGHSLILARFRGPSGTIGTILTT